MSQILTLKNWHEFQHYKDRDPTWVKLHRNIMTSESWVLGTDMSRLVQLASMMLAARYDNKIPYRFDLLKKVTHLDCNESAFKKAIAYLAETNFLEIQEVTEEKTELEHSASTTLATRSSEERREEESRGEKNGKHVAIATDVGLVFDHWKQIHNHPRAQLDDKREKVIRVALAKYAPEELCRAIDGYKRSAYHMGENERRAVYDDIELFLRDAKHIDAGLKYAEQPENIKWQ